MLRSIYLLSFLLLQSLFAAPFVGQNRASKSLLHIAQGFPASCSFSTNKTFEGQLKQSKPFSYRRFSWLTLLYL